jgi:hypothetical protein
MGDREEIEFSVVESNIDFTLYKILVINYRLYSPALLQRPPVTVENSNPDQEISL